MPSQNFRLSKWYADTVSAAGEVSIAYSAHLDWRSLSLDYASTLEHRNGTTAARSSFRRGGLSHPDPWNPNICVELYEGVRWECRIDGSYTERLILTVPPWRLPIEELRWGRFLGGRESLVWIDWQGEHPIRVAYRNAQPVEVAALSDCALALTDGTTLTLDQGCTLRTGRLGRSIPGLRRFAPAAVLALDETKWLSRATFGGESGWAIHEVVRW